MFPIHLIILIIFIAIHWNKNHWNILSIFTNSSFKFDLSFDFTTEAKQNETVKKINNKMVVKWYEINIWHINMIQGSPCIKQREVTLALDAYSTQPQPCKSENLLTLLLAFSHNPEWSLLAPCLKLTYNLISLQTEYLNFDFLLKIQIITQQINWHTFWYEKILVRMIWRWVIDWNVRMSVSSYGSQIIQ